MVLNIRFREGIKMKRHLLASTMILAASLGAASAEVTLSGSARMGVIDNFGADNTGFTSRARVVFTMSGETDTGLSFGASFRADNASGANNGTAGSVFMSGGFGKLSMGDVDGAANAAVGHVDGVGLTGLGDLNENIFLANGGLSGYIADNYTGDPTLVLSGDPSALYEYSFGNATLYASVTNPSYRFVDGGGNISGEAYSVGAAYVMGTYKFSAAYEKATQDVLSGSNDDGFYDQLIVGADGTFGAVTVKARYGAGNSDFADGSEFTDLEQWGLSATYT